MYHKHTAPTPLAIAYYGVGLLFLFMSAMVFGDTRMKMSKDKSLRSSCIYSPLTCAESGDCKDDCQLMKICYWILFALMCVINACATFKEFFYEWADILSKLGTLATAAIALIALLYTKKEYHKQQERTKISVLGGLNERYCKSEPIQRVIRFLMAREEYMDSSSKGSLSKKKRKKYRKRKQECTMRDRELFMRFFAELQISISANMIDREYAKVMFGYYAVAASDMGKEFVNDYDKIYWSLFRTFAESMRQLDYAKCLEKMKSNH